MGGGWLYAFQLSGHHAEETNETCKEEPREAFARLRADVLEDISA
jgi:hypothetical protein